LGGTPSASRKPSEREGDVGGGIALHSEKLTHSPERIRGGIQPTRESRTFSKLHGLAALPFGYLIAPPQLVARLREAGLGNPRSLNRVAVAAASASLRDEEFLAKVPPWSSANAFPTATWF
jgi:hypothetical protein